MGSDEITRLLDELRERGDPAATERLIGLLYDDLREIAGRYMRRERVDHTLQPTALVHEAYMRLVDQRAVAWQNRAHFLAVAAQTMRRILVDHARHHGAAKRDGGIQVTLSEQAAVSDARTLDLVALDEALTRLAAMDERQARVVELRFFGGLEVLETAEVLGVSPATVKRDWSFAKAWLSRELAGPGEERP